MCGENRAVEAGILLVALEHVDQVQDRAREEEDPQDAEHGLYTDAETLRNGPQTPLHIDHVIPELDHANTPAEMNGDSKRIPPSEMFTGEVNQNAQTGDGIDEEMEIFVPSFA